jgi:hypothetical protein
VSGLGQPPFDPRMMVALLLHGYASGLYSSRRIANELAAQAIRSAGGATASGNITDTGAAVIGTWAYTAVAPN